MCLGDDWDCWCNYDQNDNQIDHFYTGIYDCGATGGALRSISGLLIHCSETSTTTPQMEDPMIKKNGEGWYWQLASEHFLIADLLTLMCKSTNAQSKYGTGRCGFMGDSSNSRVGFVNAGTMNNKGMFWGDNKKLNGVKVFGIENFYGNANYRVAGYIYKSLQQLLKITPGTYDGSTASDFNMTGDGYISVQDATLVGGTDNGYGEIGGALDTLKVEKWGRLPIGQKTSNASDSTYEADSYSYGNSSAAFLATVGGGFNGQNKIGPFQTTLYSSAGWDHRETTVCLSFVPTSK